MNIIVHIKLTRIGFTVWFLGTSIYLIARAILRYVEFKTIQFDRVFEREIDSGVMNFYLTCIIAAIVLSILCIYCTIFATNNYANDCKQFGIDSLDFRKLKVKLQREHINRNLVSNNRCCEYRRWSWIKRHGPPLYLVYYVSMSVCLLLALPYLDSEKLRNGIGPTNSPRHTNLDMLFKTYHDDTSPVTNSQDVYAQFVSVEYFNLCVSLLLTSFSYSQVFWKFNKIFSLLFSIVITMSSVIFLLDAALVEMLIKVSRDPAQKIYINAPPLMTLISIVSYAMLVIHQVALFQYGFIRISETLLPRYSKNTTDSCPAYIMGNNISNQVLSVCKQLCVDSWRGVFLPFVVGIFSVVLSIFLRLSYLYGSVTIIYLQFKDKLVLVNLVMTVWFLILTMLLWVGLLIKSNWPIKSLDPSYADSNGDCSQFISRHPNTVPALPCYATINRRPMASPKLGQESDFQMFCDQSNSQFRYSCSPPSCAPNDSNSDHTASCKNGEINVGNPNYIMVMRANPVSSMVDSPNVSHGIYSHLIKLLPQASMVENNFTESVMANTVIPYDMSNNPGTQTMHMIGPDTMSLSRGTLERSSARNRELPSTEYFNIAPQLVTENDIYDHGASINTEPDTTNLCSQV